MFNLVYFQTIAYYSYKDQTEMSKIWVIDQAYSFEKAGYQPSSFLHVFGQSVQKRIKSEANLYPAILTTQAWSIKDLLFRMI